MREIEASVSHLNSGLVRILIERPKTGTNPVMIKTLTTGDDLHTKIINALKSQYEKEFGELEKQFNEG